MFFFNIVLIVIFQTIPLVGLTDIVVISDVLSIYFTYILLGIKSFVFVWKFDEILALIDAARELLQFMDRHGFGEKLKVRVRKVQSFFNTTWYFCILSVNLAPILIILLTKGPPYHIPFVMWMPFDYRYNVYGFIAITCIEYLNPLIYTGVFCSLDLLPLYFFSLSVGFLEELSDRISKIDTKLQFKEGKFIDEVIRHDHALDYELLNCIEIHLKIRRLIANSQKIFQVYIGLQAISSSIILCTTAVSLTMVI